MNEHERERYDRDDLERRGERGTPNPREVEKELDRTRARIEERAHELQERLSPGQVFERTLERLRTGGARDFLGNLGRSVSANPLPVTLSSVALGWLMLSARREGNGHDLDYESHEPGALERARAAGHGIADRGRRIGRRVRAGSERASETWNRMLADQPLVLGLLGLAAGATLGAALPRTEAEDEWMGDASDELKHKAVAKGREQVQAARAEPGFHPD